MQQCLAEIVSVGDEMTSGHRLDTNSQWLSRQLSDLGIVTGWHSTVGDDLDRQTEVFRVASQRASFVIVTGGLGPTADDLTREVLCRLTGRPLVRDENSLRHIRGIFRRYKREMPENNAVQADFPEGSKVIFNPEGTAPGIDLRITGNHGHTCQFFCLPGVPAEMFAMWNDYVRPEILTAFGTGRFMEHRVLNCFGAGESQIESMLPGITVRGRNPQVGITASMATISLRIAACGESREECELLAAADESLIRTRLGDLVFGTGQETLEVVVIREMQLRKLTLGIADAGLSGAVNQLLAAADLTGEVLKGATFARIPQDFSGLGDSQGFDNAMQTLVSRMATECGETFTVDIAVAVGPIIQGADGLGEFRVSIWSKSHCENSIIQNIGHSGLRAPRSQKQVLNKLRLVVQAMPID